MDFLKAVNIIKRDLEEAIALLEQLSGVSGPELAEIELARSRVRSASELLRLLPGLTGAKETQETMVPTAPGSAPTPDHEPAPATEPPKNQAAAQKNQEPSKAILADRFSQSGTLGDTITPARQDDGISGVMHNKPIADIGAAIGINDRFYFIRELFSGDAMAYSDTIRRLNASSSLGEAMRILDDSTVMGSDPAAQSSFVDVVRRKFSLNV